MDESIEIRKKIDEAGNIFTKYVFPVYTMKDGKPVPFGSGFFLRFEGYAFFVSAAHVLKVARERGIFIYISPGQTMALAGKLILSPGNCSDSDDIDIGVLKLSEDMILPPYVAINKFPVTLDHLVPNKRPREDSYGIIVGFPATKGQPNHREKTIKVAAYAYHTHFLEESRYKVCGLRSDVHVALELNLKKGYGIKGEHMHFPKPQGMSGSPIWVLYEEKEQQESFFPVTAIAIEYRMENKIVVGTDVSYVYELIEKFA